MGGTGNRNDIIDIWRWYSSFGFIHPGPPEHNLNSLMQSLEQQWWELAPLNLRPWYTRVKVTETSFLHKVGGLSLWDGVRNSVFINDFRNELLHLTENWWIDKWAVSCYRITSTCSSSVNYFLWQPVCGNRVNPNHYVLHIDLESWHSDWRFLEFSVYMGFMAKDNFNFKCHGLNRYRETIPQAVYTLSTIKNK